jgi:hypothetical protein
MSRNHRIKNLRVQNSTRIIEIVIDWSTGLSALRKLGIGVYLPSQRQSSYVALNFSPQ